METQWSKNDQNPFIVLWEMTRTCNFRCLHCQVKTQSKREQDELSFEEGIRLIDEIAEMNNPLLVLTGGDVLERPDLFELALYGINKGLKISISGMATPNLTKEMMNKAKEIGIHRWAFNLDGPDVHYQDALCGVTGTFQLTLDSLAYLKEIGISRQINTVLSKINYDRIEDIAKLVKSFDLAMWNIILLVPTLGNNEISPLTSSEHELFFQWLYDFSQKVPFTVKTTYGQHFQRVVIQNKMREQRIDSNSIEYKRALLNGPLGVKKLFDHSSHALNDGNGSLFISHTGDVYPSKIMRIKTGNIKEESLKVIYHYSPLFKKLQNPDLLRGKCGICEYRYVCGGNRSRAYNMTGDYLESEPYCLYMPKKAYHTPEKVLVK